GVSILLLLPSVVSVQRSEEEGTESVARSGGGRNRSSGEEALRRDMNRPRQAGDRLARPVFAGGTFPCPGGAGELRRSVGGELLLLGRPAQRGGRGVGRDGRADQVEVAGADLALVAGGGVAAALGGELRLLEVHVRGHALTRVPVREVEHRVVERVEPGEGDELELVPHVPQLALELGDGGVVE